MTDTAGAVTVQKHPIVILRERLENRASELKAALPDDIKPEQFIRAAMTSASLNPDILACSWPSIWNALLRACRDGLLPDGIEGALVPFKSNANWIPMYQGLLRRFRRSGQFKWLTANVVHEGEKFEHFIDETGEHFKHVPSDSSGPVVRTYACALTKDGGFFVTVMSPAEIDKIKRMSRATRDDAPWKLWEDEMRKKTALRRLSKLLPSARDLVPGEEEEPDEEALPAITLADIPREARPSGAGAALDQFVQSVSESAAPETEPTASRAPVPSHAGGAGDQAAGAADSSQPQEEQHARAPDADHQVMLQAYERGKQAKAAGHQRKAMPGEYRDTARQREGICWQAGFDGNPLPTFKGSENA